jgi:hypothetical protein
VFFLRGGAMLKLNQIVSSECSVCRKLVWSYHVIYGKNICLKCWLDKKGVEDAREKFNAEKRDEISIQNSNESGGEKSEGNS